MPQIIDEEIEFVKALQKAMSHLIKEYCATSKDIFKTQKDRDCCVGIALTMVCLDLDKEFDPRFTYRLCKSLVYSMR